MKRYIKSASKNDLKNQGKELFGILVKYDGYPIGYAVEKLHRNFECLQVQTNPYDKTKAHGPFLSRETQIRYRVNKNYYSSTSFILLNDSDIIGTYLSIDKPYLVSRGRLGGIYIKLHDYPLLDFKYLNFEVVKAEDIISGKYDTENSYNFLESKSLPSLEKSIPDFNEYKAFLQGYNSIFKNIVEDNSYYELVQSGVGSILENYYDEIIDIANEYGQLDNIEYWFNRLPEPHKSNLLDMLDAI